MKKQLLTGAFLLASFFAAQAQDVIYSQDFEDFDEVFPDTGASWITIDSDGDGEVFGGYFSSAGITNLGFSGNVMGSPNFTIVGEGEDAEAIPTEGADNTALSVFFNFTEDADLDLIASFKLACGALEQGASSPYEVYIVTDADMDGIDSDATFTAMLDGKTPVKTGSVTALETVSVDFSEAAGGIAAIAIRNRNSDDTGIAYLFMDDFTVVTGVLSTDEHLASSFSVFPNPATDVVNVGNTENILINNVKIVDLNGRTVKSVQFAGVADANVNISDLSSGVYMLTASTEKGSITKKIVKN